MQEAAPHPPAARSQPPRSSMVLQLGTQRACTCPCGGGRWPVAIEVTAQHIARSGASAGAHHALGWSVGLPSWVCHWRHSLGLPPTVARQYQLPLCCATPPTTVTTASLAGLTVPLCGSRGASRPLSSVLPGHSHTLEWSVPKGIWTTMDRGLDYLQSLLKEALPLKLGRSRGRQPKLQPCGMTTPTSSVGLPGARPPLPAPSTALLLQAPTPPAPPTATLQRQPRQAALSLLSW